MSAQNMKQLKIGYKVYRIEHGLLISPPAFEYHVFRSYDEALEAVWYHDLDGLVILPVPVESYDEGD